MLKETKNNKNIKPTEITEELRDSYLDYAMSVIISRALPDIRDGLKPVQRRILYAMNELGLTHNSKTRKSATVVGETLGKFHPHGDMAVYDALVRMAQDFSLRYPLIEGQGNFGSIDGDPPGAMRYTECRLTKIAGEMLEDLNKETVDFIPNYDNTRLEPKYLSAKLPQLILNGTMGIAVGMATNIPSHNLKEVADAIIYLIDHEDASIDDLMHFIKGPDFPTGGIVYGINNIKEAYATGKGSILCRAKTEIIEDEKEHKIIITELPYQVNKADLISKIASLVEEKKIEGIKDLRDETDKEGLRVTIDLQKNALPNHILNQLFKFTELEKPFYVNMLALVENGLQPKILSLKEILLEYINHRKIVIRRRTEFLLRKIKERIHILEGLKTALDHIDEIIKLIKSAESQEDAKKKLMNKYKFTEIQANAILEIKLANLAKLEKQKIEDELKEKQKLAADYELILKQPKRILEIIKKELIELKEKYGDERRTQIEPNLPREVKEEELIQEKEILITFSQTGYIKRMDPNNLRVQKRGGKGVIAYETKNEDDLITHIITASTPDKILFFTDKGYLYQISAFEINEASRTSKGKLIQNYLNLRPDEKVIVILNLKKDDKNKNYLVLLTKNGIIKKTKLDEYSNMRRAGIVAIKLSSNDTLVGATLTSGNDDLLIITKNGQAIRFSEKDLRPMSRQATGVKGIKLLKEDEVKSLLSINSEFLKQNPLIVLVTENGYGKRTKLSEYRKQKRGGSGIKTAKITEKTGKIVKALLQTNEETLIAVSKKAQMIKAPLDSVSILKRSTQGIKIMTLEEGDKIAGASLL
ncbi:MAG: DNA gyrase subunit A [Minisyncoccia bacterium]